MRRLSGILAVLFALASMPPFSGMKVHTHSGGNGAHSHSHPHTAGQAADIKTGSMLVGVVSADILAQLSGLPDPRQTAASQKPANPQAAKAAQPAGSKKDGQGWHTHQTDWLAVAVVALVLFTAAAAVVLLTPSIGFSLASLVAARRGNSRAPPVFSN